MVTTQFGTFFATENLKLVKKNEPPQDFLTLGCFCNFFVCSYISLK